MPGYVADHVAKQAQADYDHGYHSRWTDLDMSFHFVREDRDLSYDGFLVARPPARLDAYPRLRELVSEIAKGDREFLNSPYADNSYKSAAYLRGERAAIDAWTASRLQHIDQAVAADRARLERQSAPQPERSQTKARSYQHTAEI